MINKKRRNYNLKIFLSFRGTPRHFTRGTFDTNEILKEQRQTDFLTAITKMTSLEELSTQMV